MVRKWGPTVFALVVIVVSYYVISRAYYFKAAHAAFPQLPIDSSCYFLPWPAGPQIVGQLEPDDPIYLSRDSLVKESQGFKLIIFDSSGNFLVEPSDD